MHYLLCLFLPYNIFLELLKSPEVSGDGAVTELHLMDRRHHEGGSEQEAAHGPDDHREHPEVPRSDAAPHLPLPRRAPQPPDVGGSDPPLAAQALRRCRAHLTDAARTIHIFRCPIKEAPLHEPWMLLHWSLASCTEEQAKLACHRGQPQLNQHGNNPIWYYLAVELFSSLPLPFFFSLDQFMDNVAIQRCVRVSE